VVSVLRFHVHTVILTRTWLYTSVDLLGSFGIG
jgi:hypothetical protein